VAIIKTLTDNGRKLADLYRTRGTKFGLEAVDTTQVVLTHDMGREIGNERLAYELLWATKSGVSQSTNFNTAITVPFDTFQLLAVNVSTDSGDGGKFAEIYVQVDNYNSAGAPIWLWNSTTGTFMNAPDYKYTIGGATADRDLFLPLVERTPLTLPGREQPSVANAKRTVRHIQFKGVTNAFGAGTVDLACQLAVVHMSDLVNDGERKIFSGALAPVW